jgi:hypothetical protein
MVYKNAAMNFIALQTSTMMLSMYKNVAMNFIALQTSTMMLSMYKNVVMNFIALQTSTMMFSQCCIGHEASGTMKKECNMGPIPKIN